MSIQIKFPERFSLAGNPMLVQCKTDSRDSIRLRITINEGELMELDLDEYPVGVNGEFYTSCDISEVVRSAFREYLFESDKPVSIIDSQTIRYYISVQQNNAELGSFDGIAFNGGVDNRSLEELARLNIDMFNYRLNNYQRNFLFTTRTNHHHLKLKANELYPFFFIYPDQLVSFVSNKGDRINGERFAEDSPCLMDIAQVRQAFVDKFNYLPSYLELHVGGYYSFHISIEGGLLSEDSYAILFKNSLGAYEKLELTGVFSKQMEYDERNSYEQLQELGFFKKKRKRLSSTESFVGQTGYKTQEELSFLRDAIASDDSYFIHSDGEMEECEVSMEGSLTVPLRMVKPQSIQLKITSNTSSEYLSPKLDFGYPEHHGNPNITRLKHPEINHRGLIFAKDNIFYAE